jgi:hypothetical protein
VDSIKDLLPFASFLVATAAAAGFTFQRGWMVSLRERVDDLTKENTALKDGRVEDKATIAQLTSDIDAVRRSITGEVHWQAISEVLDHHDAAAREHWEREEHILTQVRDALARAAISRKENPQ